MLVYCLIESIIYCGGSAGALLLAVEAPAGDGHGFGAVERAGRRELERARADATRYASISAYNFTCMLKTGSV